MATAPPMSEEEIRRQFDRWDELSYEDKRRLTAAVDALPEDRREAVKRELGLKNTGGTFKLSFGKFGQPSIINPDARQTDVYKPVGLLAAKEAAKQAPEAPGQAPAEAAVNKARGLVAPPDWLMSILGPKPDDTAIAKFASAYSRLTGRDITDRAALFRDPGVQGKSSAAMVAASLAFNVGADSRTEFRYRNVEGQERKATLGAEGVALAVQQQPGFLPHIQKVAIAAEESGVPWQVIFGVIRAMSNWDPGKVSRLGAPPAAAGTTAGSASNRESESDTAAAEGPAPRDTPGGIKHIAEMLDAYFEELGDWGLAVMAMEDPEAARELKATGRTSNLKAFKFIQKAMFGPNGQPNSETSLVSLGWDTDGFDLEAYEAVQRQVGAGGAKPVQLPDRESIAQQVRGFFKNLLLRDASDQEVNGFITLIEGQIIAAQQLADQGAGNPYDLTVKPPGERQTVRDVDPQAQLEAHIRGTDEFKRLYAAKPSWMEEGQYTGQIASQAGGLLGRPPDDEALRVGMESGGGQALDSFILARDTEKTTSLRERLYAASKILNGL